MAIRWRRCFRLDPLPVLVESENPAVRHLARRDLLDESPGPDRRVWDLPAPSRILRKQQPDGSWRYRGTTRYHYPDTGGHP